MAALKKSHAGTEQLLTPKSKRPTGFVFYLNLKLVTFVIVPPPLVSLVCFVKLVTIHVSTWAS